MRHGLLVLCLCLGGGDAVAEGFSDALIREANASRAGKGRAALVRDPTLDRLAQGHANDMARTGRVNHAGFHQRTAAIRRSWPSSGRVGENVAMRFGRTPTPRQFVDMWAESRSHRANLFGPYTHAGTAVARGPSGAWYAVQLYVADRR
jgi:uncharacterized protein YkwD